MIGVVFLTRSEHGRPAAVDEVLVYSGSWEVRGLALRGAAAAAAAGAGADGNVLPPLAQVGAATALAYSAAGEWLYWADAEAGGVWRVRRDGSRRELVARTSDADGPAALAVDWLAGNVYWSRPRRCLVEAARLSGGARFVLLDTAPMAVARMALDAAAGWLFLAGGGWLQRARPDGSARALLRNGSAIADVALDTQVRTAATCESSQHTQHYDTLYSRNFCTTHYNFCNYEEIIAMISQLNH